MDEIVKAINSRRLIAITYSGKSRVVEPYLCGKGSNGNLLLRGYQVSGGSTGDKQEGWKLFKIDEIESAERLNDGFSGRSEYSSSDKAIPEVIAKYD